MDAIGIWLESWHLSRLGPNLLVLVFLVHTGAFLYLYHKRRRFHTLLLVLAFPLLVVYYLLESLQVHFTGMLWLRVAGIATATLALILMVKGRLKKAAQKTPDDERAGS